MRPRYRLTILGLVTAGIAFFVPQVPAGAHPGHAEAKRRLGESMLSRPHDAGLFVERARHERLDGDLDSARRDLAHAEQLDPNSASLALEYAELAHLDGADDQAIAHLDRAIVLDPRWWRPWRLRAEILDARGDEHEAIASYFRLIELRPRPEHHLRVAQLLERSGAIQLAERVLAEASLSGSVASRIAHIELLRRAGWTDVAAELLQNFRRREPTLLTWAELSVEVELDADTPAVARLRLDEARRLARRLADQKTTPARLAALERLEALDTFLSAYERSSNAERGALACLP